ncbi:MAG: hypothetical protein IJY22_03800 [Clostridia bacterium]|nr:hypothetical protein [Clostridia bacterium]
MKRVVALLLCLLLAFSTILMTACDEEVAPTPNDPNAGTNPGGDSGNNGNQGTHVHTFKTDADWSYDANSHWYDATCDCADVTLRKLNHVDDNKDGACDVCKYSDHEHTYAEEWTVDCTNHWNAADCGCIVAGANVEAHADSDNDGICDECGYMIENLHNHYYATEWSSDGAYHWHAALCEHGVEVADKAAHELNAAGDCIVCGAHILEINANDIAAVLAATQANDYKVAYGDVIAVDRVYGGTGAQTLQNGKTNKVHFALGNGQSYIQYISFDMNGNYIGQEEQWHEALGDEKFFAVAMLNGDYELSPIMGAAQFLNGYNYIPGSIIPSDSADTSTLANMLSALYNQMKAGERVSNAVESVEDGVYKFAYTYYSVNAHTTGGEVYHVELELYNVKVEFTVNDDMIIDSAEFEVEVYRDYSNIQNGIELGDSDLSYTWVDNGDMTVTINDLQLKPTANPTFYNYTVAQTSGERTFTSPYPKASLIPTSFEFNYVTETKWDENYTKEEVVSCQPIGDSFSILTGTYAKFNIGDILPKTASSKFLSTDDLSFSFVNNDPNSTAQAWYESDAGIMNGYNSFSQMLKIKIRDVGSYTVTLGFGDLTKTFVLNVVDESGLVVPEDTADTKYVVTTDTYAWEDQYTFTAPESGTYTFTIPAGLGFWFDDEQAPRIDYNEQPNGGTVTFELAANDSVDFTVGAATKNVVWSIGVSFVAGEVEGGEGGEGGEVGDITGTYSMTALYQNPLTLVIDETTVTFTCGSITVSYNYEIVGGAVVIYKPDSTEAWGEMFYAIELTDGAVSGATYNGNSYTLTAGGGEGGGDDPVPSGPDGSFANPFELQENNTCEFPGGYNYLFYKYTATESGTLTITMLSSDYYWAYGTGEWEMNNMGAMVATGDITLAAGDVVYIGMSTNSSNAATLDFTATFTAGGGSEGGDEGDDEGDDPVVDSDAALKESLMGDYKLSDEYMVSLGMDYVNGGYQAMVYNSDWSVCLYFAYAIVDNGDNTYTLTPTYKENDYESGAEKLDAILALDWTIAIDPVKELLEGQYTVNGYGVTIQRLNGEYVAQIADIENYSFTLYFTYDVTDNGNGNYTLALTYLSIPDYENGTENKDTLVAMNWAISIDPVKQAVIGYHYFGDYTMNLYRDSETGEYCANVWDSTNWTFDLYFTYTVTDNGNGTKTINLTYAQNIAEQGIDSLNAVLAYDFTIGEVEGGEDVGDDEVLEGSGTEEDPYVIPETGDYTCAFPGGYNAIWYTYTVPANGYVTLSTTFGQGGWLMLGTDGYSANNNSNYGDGSALTLFLTAGSTCLFGVGDWGESVCDVPFNLAFEEFVSDPVDHLVGDWVGTEATMYWGDVTYTFTINADATGSGIINMNGSDMPVSITYILVDGNTVTLHFDTGYTAADVVCTYDATTSTLTFARGMRYGSGFFEMAATGELDKPLEIEAENSCAFPGGYNYVFYTYTATVDGALKVTFDGDDFYWIYGDGATVQVDMGTTPVATIPVTAGQVVYIGVATNSGDAATITFKTETITYNTVIESGNNTLYFSPEEIAAGTADRKWNVEQAKSIMYQFSGLTVSAVLDPNGTPIVPNADGTYTMVMGLCTVTFDLQEVEADTACVLTLVESYDYNAPIFADDANVVYISPAEMTADTASRPFTVTEAGNYKFAANNLFVGSVTDSTGTAVTKNDDLTYTLAVGEYTVTFTMLKTFGAYANSALNLNVIFTPVAEEEEGGEVEEITGQVTYYAEHAGGRKLLVTIDTEAGTMTITRSDLSGSFGTGGQSITEYTYAYADGEVSVVLTSGTACTFEWNTDGSPKSITWGSQKYENFTIQA